MTNTKIIVLLGNSGAGKGTQAELLRKEYNLEDVGSGEILRKFSEGKSFSAKKTKMTMQEGHLIPGFLISSIWSGIFEDFKNSSKHFRGFILDGSPRRMQEAIVLDESFKWYEWDDYAYFVYIKISRREAIKRVTHRKVCKLCQHTVPYLPDFKHIKVCPVCGGQLVRRSDDNDLAAVRNRTELFKKEVIPVLRHYKKQHKLYEVDGQTGIQEVFNSIKKIVE